MSTARPPRPRSIPPLTRLIIIIVRRTSIARRSNRNKSRFPLNFRNKIVVAVHNSCGYKPRAVPRGVFNNRHVSKAFDCAPHSSESQNSALRAGPVVGVLCFRSRAMFMKTIYFRELSWFAKSVFTSKLIRVKRNVF